MLSKTRRFLPGLLAIATLLAFPIVADAKPEPSPVTAKQRSSLHRTHHARRHSRTRLAHPGSSIQEQRWVAHWYAGRFVGRRTASGEVYNPEAYTAAARGLPLGSVVRVQLIGTTRFVDVTINDRTGNRGRIIDLSPAAARALGILRRGTAEVRLSRL